MDGFTASPAAIREDRAPVRDVLAKAGAPGNI